MRPRPSVRSSIIESDSDDDFQEFEAGPSKSKVQRKEDTLATEEENSGDKSSGNESSGNESSGNESSGDESSENKIDQGTILLVYTLG